MTVLDEARRRAQEFLVATDYFAGLGLEKASADARMCARYVLELADELEAERSARVAIQEARDRCLAIIGKAAYDQVRGAA